MPRITPTDAYVYQHLKNLFKLKKSFPPSVLVRVETKSQFSESFQTDTFWHDRVVVVKEWIHMCDIIAKRNGTLTIMERIRWEVKLENQLAGKE